MNKFRKSIFNEIIDGDKPSSSLIFEYIASQNKPGISYFCFLEGKTDKYFYCGILPKKLNASPNSIEYLYAGKGEGKESVIFAAQHILRKKKHENNGKKAIFIVDRDYNDELVSIKYKDVYDKLSILPCYSFENFYFSPEENIKIVFRELLSRSLWKHKYSEFIDVYATFYKTIVKYCAWKKICVLNYNIESIECDHKDNVKDDFINHPFCIPFKFPDNIQSFIDEAVTELKYKHPKLYDDFLRYLDVFNKDNTNIMGKFLFILLTKYLHYRCNTLNKLEYKLYNMSKKLIVTFDVKLINL